MQHSHNHYVYTRFNSRTHLFMVSNKADLEKIEIVLWHFHLFPFFSVIYRYKKVNDKCICIV
jgi:hypothetical protein